MIYLRTTYSILSAKLSVLTILCLFTSILVQALLQVLFLGKIAGGIKLCVDKFNGFYSGEITIISRII